MKAVVYSALVIVIAMGLASSVCAQEKTEEKEAVKADEALAAETEKKPEENPMVIIETNYGNITLELFQKQAPLSVENFLSYVRDGFYDGTTFHRVVKGFVLQAGGINEEMKQKKQKAPIQNEATNGLSNKTGTLSMARTSAINSGTSHFFVNLVDNTRLDHTGMAPAQYGYAVFGKVAEGWDVVEKIANVKVTNKGQFQNVPAKPVTIKTAYVVSETEESEEAAEKQEEPMKDVKKEAKKAKDE